MTTPNADNNASNAGPEGGNEDVLENTGTESLLTGQEGEEASTDEEVEAAMLEGFNRANPSRTTDDASAGKKHGKDETGEQADEQQPKEGQPPAKDAAPTQEEDYDIPGLGKASEVKARLGRLDALEKTVASANGHIGHLKQMIQTAGKGKTITGESLVKIREEFGPEYADALAADLNAAGIGGGSTVDEETLGRIVNERVAAEREVTLQAVEKRMVRKAHPDAADYFAGGKHNADFLKFVEGLPKERQELLAETWDSDVINPVLDEFKASRAKVETEKTKQNRRLERAALPTASRGVSVAAPSEDPMEAGWRKVKGDAKGGRAGIRA